MSDQELLDLLMSGEVAAVHTDTHWIEGHCQAVAIWLKEEAMPLYFRADERRGMLVAAWVMSCAYDPAFLMAGPYILAAAQITHTDLGWDRDIPVLRIHMTGATPLFALPRESEAAEAVRRWQKPAVDDEATAPRVIALAAAS